MSKFLANILESKRAEVAAAKAARPLSDLTARAQAAGPVRDFAAALTGQGPSVIAEIKRASPSKGTIRPDLDPCALARAYQQHGASAISVLTDGPFFSGSLDDLTAARACVSLPVLRKDFTVDAYQVVEARAAGADAVLLIVAALDDNQLAELHQLAGELSMTALVEVHNQSELERALRVSPAVVGINHRDLTTFSMDMDLFAKLAAQIPRGVIRVAESGIRTASDVRRLHDEGADAVLVGETLMRRADPGLALRELIA